MAILQSIDGRFYQVPEDEAEKFLVPADKVEETLRACGAAQPQAAPAPAAGCMPAGSGQAPVIIYIVGGGGQGGMGPQPMGGGLQEQMPVQAYAHHGGHGGHHGGHWGGHWGGWGGHYSNYSNYRNYYNYYGW